MTEPRPLFAGANLRAAALVVDAIVVFALVIVTALAVEAALETRPQYFLWILIALYFIVPPATRWQGTPGKRANGLRITTLSGAPAGPGRSALRFAASLVSWATFGLGFAVCFWNAKRRTLHDYIAGTVVVDAKAAPADIAAAVPAKLPWTTRILGSVVFVLLFVLPMAFVLEGMNARVAWQLNARNLQAVEPVVKALEAHRARHGRYPARLPELGPDPPRLQERTALYYAATDAGDGCWLAIVYWRRAGLLPSDDVREYDCAARQWQVKDYADMKARKEGGY